MKLLYEINVEIFKYVETPISLALTNRNWYYISQDPHARAKWLLFKYGRAHALFHAVRLGNKFLTITVCKCLIEQRKAILSRYFLQKLMVYNIKFNPKLLNDNQKIWGGDIEVEVFNYITHKAFNLYKNEMYINGNDIESLHYLTGGPLAIASTLPQIIKNIDDIKDLILEKKFIPFPPFPFVNTCRCECYIRGDGYENARQLNILARAIAIYPDLINMWKQIGYYDICNDLNTFVLQRVYGILLQPDSSNQINWKPPNVSDVVERLKIFIDHGFTLDKQTVKALIYLFNDKMTEVGDVLFKSIELILSYKN